MEDPSRDQGKQRGDAEPEPQVPGGLFADLEGDPPDFGPGTAPVLGSARQGAESVLNQAGPTTSTPITPGNEGAANSPSPASPEKPVRPVPATQPAPSVSAPAQAGPPQSAVPRPAAQEPVEPAGASSQSVGSQGHQAQPAHPQRTQAPATAGRTGATGGQAASGRSQQAAPRPSSPQAVPASPTGAGSLPHGVATEPTAATGNRPQSAAQGAGQTRAARPILVRRPDTPAPLVRPKEGSPEKEEEFTEKAVRAAPPWLVSGVFHMLLLIILGLVFLPEFVRHQIELETVWAEKLGDQLEFDSFLAGTSQDEVEEPILTPENLPEVPDPFAAPPKVEMVVPNATTSTSDIPSTQIGLALTGREEGMKHALLAAYGGTGTTEAAVQLGLKWLARNQKKQGQWSLVEPYSDGAINENEAAATAMALLAFQGAGNTHRRGQFKDNVARGWEWLLKEQDADGNFFHEGPFNHRFYTHCQCTIALCELYGMTKDEKLKEPAERALQYLLKSQSSEGGWRYSPQADSDLSVTGWAVMALQSARMSYLAVPDDTFRRIERFLDRVSHEDGTRYSYQRGHEPTRVMTAEALLCRQYLGWPRNDERLIDGVEYITRPANLINYGEPDVYYWYYATQVCHHMEGEHWKRWNEVMRQEVPEHQLKAGREAGSWDPVKPRRDEWADHGGRLYVTCLSIYMLEVYYRHLPIYTNVYHLLSTGR